MLKHLLISNYVLIDRLEVYFEEGMSVITGETGAGKSILFGALSLLQGRRAESAEIRQDDRKCILEAKILLDEESKALFEKYDLDFYEEAIFRREISPQGKSRAFINDTPVKLDQMQSLGEQCFDIHGQHQSRLLGNREYRLSILDELSNNQSLLKSYQQKFSHYRKLQSEVEQLRENAREAKQEEDYLQFQFQELDQLGLKPGEEEQLESEHRLLANGDQLLSLISAYTELMEGEEQSALSQLHMAGQQLVGLERLDSKFKELRERFESAQIDLKEISREIAGIGENFTLDTERLQQIEDRISAIHNLKQKHSFSSANELINYAEEIEQKLLAIGNYDEEIKQKEEECIQAREKIDELAEQLSTRRKASMDMFRKSVIETLHKLGIPRADFAVNHELKEAGPDGIDLVDFMFTANAGKAMQKVRKIASGGELSRLMLAIKRLLAQHKQMPALLFDEIDTGVSGEVADQLGKILKEMSAVHQIIAITHLPQIAAKGHQHYFVYKEGEAMTTTKMKKLEPEERVEELAKMLSGEKISSAAMNNARELLAH